MALWNFKFVYILAAIVMNRVATQSNEFNYQPRIGMCDGVPSACLTLYSGCFYWPQLCRVKCSATGDRIISECNVWYDRINGIPECSDIYCTRTYSTTIAPKY